MSRAIRGIQVALAVALVLALLVFYRMCLWNALTFAASHLALVGVLVLVYGFIYGQIGTMFGIEKLFWHDGFRTRVSSSLAVTLLLAEIGTIVFYVGHPSAQAIDALLGQSPGGADSTGSAENVWHLSRFLVVAGVPFLALLAAPALLPAAFAGVPRSALAFMVEADRADARRGRSLDISRSLRAWAAGLVTWLLGIGLGLLVVAALLLISLFLERHLLGGHPVLPGQVEPTRPILIFYALFLGFYVVLAWPFYQKISPAFALCALLGVFALTYFHIAYLSAEIMPQALQGWGNLLPVSMLLLLLAWFWLVNNDPYKMRFPQMAAYYPGGGIGLVPLRETVGALYLDGRASVELSGEAARLLSDEVVLKNWRSSASPRATGSASPGVKPKLVLVAVSGGATRAAFWAAVVLDRLEREVPGFHRHVRIITGASGGMVGTAYYVKHCRDRLEPAASPRPLVPSLPVDSIKPVARFIALRNLWLGLIPRIGDDDRGVRLEGDWGGIQFPLQDLLPLEEAGQVPSLIFSPMIVEDGRRLLISNLDLWELTRTQGGEITYDDSGRRGHNYSLSALEFFRLFPRAKGFHLSTAVRMSASFPYVSPAVNLPTDPPRRVVDAGYYDNFGIQVAGAWIEKNLAWLLRETSGVLLVQIRDAVSQEERLEIADAPQGAWARVARGFHFFTSPIDGAARAVVAASAFRNDQDVQSLSDLFTDKIRARIESNPSDESARAVALEQARAFFTTVVFENSADVTFGPRNRMAWPGDESNLSHSATNVALDWYLSHAERAGLVAAIPTPSPGSRWEDRDNRLERIRSLLVLVARTHGRERDEGFKQLEQARNYERLVSLKEWWSRPGAEF